MDFHNRSMDAVGRNLLLNNDERRLAVGFDYDFPVAEFIHGPRHALDDRLVSQAFASDEMGHHLFGPPVSSDQ